MHEYRRTLLQTAKINQPWLAGASAFEPIHASVPPIGAPLPQAHIIASREHRLFRAALRSDGILVYHPIPGLVITYEVACTVLEVGLEIIDGPKPTLVLMQDMARVDRDARAFFASEEYMTRLSCQTALVVGSPVSRVIANFFVGLNRPSYPHKVFDDAERAITWLRGYVR